MDQEEDEGERPSQQNAQGRAGHCVAPEHVIRTSSLLKLAAAVHWLTAGRYNVVT